MTGEAVRDLLAIPADWQRGDPVRWTLLLDYLVEHPAMFSQPSTPDQRRVAIANHLVNPAHAVWEVWRGGTFCGILSLTRINPGVDALFHFVFLDGNLLGKRDLLVAWLGRVYRDYRFQRISFEVPETVPQLVKFARQKLGFRYEGENVATGHKITKALESGGHGLPKVNNAHVWVASQGARREQSHWVPPSDRTPTGRWVDVVLLRQTADEFVRLMEARECPPVSLEPQPLPL